MKNRLLFGEKLQNTNKHQYALDTVYKTNELRFSTHSTINCSQYNSQQNNSDGDDDEWKKNIMNQV